MEKVYRPEGMNIELTTCCPLRCPQCYCSLEGGKHIPLDKAVRVLEMAGKMGVNHVELSGGETLCYPHLYEVIRAARDNGIEPNIAISGWHFDDQVLARLIEAGLEGIFVSLNAPTKETNALSRDGFEYSIAALETLDRAGFKNTHINWVMHRDTADLLPEMISLAEKYHVGTLVIMTPKPTAAHELNSLPTAEQLLTVAKLVKTNKSSVDLVVESCFSPLLALVGRSALLGNLNHGPDKGCRAGCSSFSVNVDGEFSPCRHLDYFEHWDSLEAYWENSEILKTLRFLDEDRKEPCASCQFTRYCRHCVAINSKLNHALYIGNDLCPLAKCDKL